ncbi:MAG TPA: hypothetical protein VGC27_03795 [Rhizomicrobium sp.]
MTSKRSPLIWADKIALFMALLVAAGALLCWAIGIVGLDGRSHSRFDSAVFNWTVDVEAMLVLPLWLFLRIVDFIARALGRWLQIGSHRDSSGGLRLTS